MARVFISHSSRDREQAEEIFAWLKAQGFEQGFLDIDKHQGIPPGERWEQKLYDELDRAQAMILVLTENWFDSKWCFAEFAQARLARQGDLPARSSRRTATSSSATTCRSSTSSATSRAASTASRGG